MDQTTFGAVPEDQGWARVPNGTGPFVIQDPTFAANNNFASVHEIAADVQLTLYPNPANNALWLVSTEHGTQDITATDATGRAVWNGQLRSRAVVDVSTWAPGSYIVRVGNTAQQFMVVR